jgi:hypothetical protein
VNELFDFRIRNKLSGNAPVVHLGKGNQMVRYTPLNTANTDGVISGNTITYPEAWANADLKITLGGHILRKDIILRAGHPQSFAFRIDDKANMDDDLVGSEFYITRPYLFKGDGFVQLDWVKTSVGGKTVLTVNLPPGNWDGWTLDPTYTSQPDGTAGIDTKIMSNAATTNYGTATTLEVVDADDTYDAWKYSSLLKFDLSTIAAGSTVTSASLYLRQQQGTHAFTIQCYRTLRDWVEAQATWNIYKTSNNWGTAGCRNSTSDYNSTSIGSSNLTVASGTDVNMTLSNSLIQTMLPSGSFTNNGFVLHSFTTVGGFDDVPDAIFTSSDGTTASQRPKLTIEYTESGGATVKPAYYYQQQ